VKGSKQISEGVRRKGLEKERDVRTPKKHRGGETEQVTVVRDLEEIELQKGGSGDEKGMTGGGRRMCSVSRRNRGSHIRRVS